MSALRIVGVTDTLREVVIWNESLSALVALQFSAVIFVAILYQIRVNSKKEVLKYVTADALLLLEIEISDSLQISHTLIAPVYDRSQIKSNVQL